MIARTRYIDAPIGRREATHYDVIVEAWNRLTPGQRRERAAECATNGHDWAPLSFGPVVCKRCLRYDDAEKG